MCSNVAAVCSLARDLRAFILSATLCHREDAVAEFKQLIERLEDDLGTITQRLFVLEAFAAELERVTRDKPFRIWGSAVWMMILDSRDTHVTHLASWLKALYRKGGFFGQLAAQHSRALQRKWRPQPGSQHSEHFAAILKEQHDEAFSRLFPGVTRAVPGPGDFDALRQRFIDAVKHVVADRDENRAHPYEKSGAASGTAKQLDLKELRRVTTTVEAWLNDLRLVSTSSSFVHTDMNFQGVESLAEDLVDSVLIGSRSRASLVMAGADREQYYEDIHARHRTLGSPDEPLFNDYIKDDSEL